MTARSVLGRPRRTKVYDCNFNAGERYYRPVVDSLDRKTGGTASPDSGSFPTLRSALSAERNHEAPPSFRRAASPRLDGDDFDIPEPRRKANTNLLDEYDSIYENRNRGIRAERSPNRKLRALEDEADQEIASYLKRIRETRPAKPSLEDEFETAVTPRGSKRRSKIDFQEKLLDSVGLKNSTALEDDTFFKKRTLKMTSEDDEEASSLTKWSALSRNNKVDGDSEDFGGSAAARARKTRSRLQDLNTEIEDLENRSAAREKRVAQLRAFVKENEANAAESAMSNTRVVKATVRTEKKTVTF